MEKMRLSPDELAVESFNVQHEIVDHEMAPTLPTLQCPCTQD